MTLPARISLRSQPHFGEVLDISPADGKLGHMRISADHISLPLSFESFEFFAFFESAFHTRTTRTDTS